MFKFLIGWKDGLFKGGGILLILVGVCKVIFE